MYTFNYINQLYIVFDTHHTYAKFIFNDKYISILSQKVPKFELYKHNDELFNIYYGIFYEL
jgi:hypothetical protein